MSIYDTLNERQKEGVFTTQGPVLLLAGAGSGKTRVLTHRIAYLIDEEHVDPYNILAITFTNKAAGEMRERVEQTVGFGADSIWVATFHSTCVRILRRYADRIGYDNNFVIYDTDDTKSIMKKICKDLQIDTKYLKERTILSAISSCKNENISSTEYAQSAIGDYTKGRISKAYFAYENELRKNNAMDFDDLLVNTVRLFKECPDVLENYQKRFQYIHVDEYQDTNSVQFEMIRLLAAAHHNLCVVGDDDQSIYKFRGANIRNILDFEKHYPEATVIKLEQNYRSTQNILSAANAVIAHNVGRKEKSLWTEAGNGSLVHYRPYDNAYQEAEAIADEIARLVRKDIAAYKECAVLYRTNAQSRMLEERFVVEGIPYKLVGGVNFYARKEIKDLLAYLKTVDNGRDDLAVRRIINVPKRGIGQTSISKVQEYADERGISFYDALCMNEDIPGLGAAAKKIVPFVNMIQVFRSKLSFYKTSDLLKDIIASTNYVELLKEDGEEDAEERIGNIDELISKVTAFEETNPDATLTSFLQEVALVADIDGVDADDDYVLLMTLHAAKGLEFDHVYLAGLEDGLFPSYMSITSDDNMDVEEERRLMYVGMTRARKELTLTCARSRMIRGETQYNDVSRFVREIPVNLMDNRPLKKRGYDDDYSSGSVGESAASFVDRYNEMMKSSNSVDTSARESGYGRSFSSDNSSRNMDTVFDLKKPTVSARRGGDNSLKSIYGIGSGTGTAGGGSALPKVSVKTTPLGKSFSMPGVSKGISSAISAPDYAEGDRVEHVKFGVGTVLKIEKETKDYKVTVSFDGLGTKIMYAGFAKLKKK
ncbi:MAG: UvrD-helicase domain-containing protein [Lachnospiraceae bacterium]|nr:UvrD-helicase domain-containing protein [Candidatus Merdinaster equi]